MDRLTEYVDGEARHVQTGKVGYKDCLKKLAAYENTGLEPEEIRKVLTDNAKVILESASAEEQNGRLLKENEMLRELLATAIEDTKIPTDNILNFKGVHTDDNKTSKKELKLVKKLARFSKESLKFFEEVNAPKYQTKKICFIAVDHKLVFYDNGKCALKPVVVIKGIETLAQILEVKPHSDGYYSICIDYDGVTFIEYGEVALKYEKT